MTKRDGPDPSFVSPAVCVASNLRRISRIVTQAYEDALKPSGITISQFSTLGTLFHAGPLSIHKLAELLEIDRTTLARNLKPLEREQLITIEPDEHDKRVKAVHLTEKGIDALEVATPLWIETQNRFVSGLGNDHYADLLHTFGQLNALADPA